MNQHDTALAGAFKKAGVDANEIRFRADLSRYINNGGSFERAAAIIQELSGEGLCGLSGSGHGIAANSRQPDANGAGQSRIAAEATVRVPVAVRSPSVTQISANARVAKAVAVSAFERELTHTGRQWGNVTYRELDSLAEDGDIALAIKTHIGSLRGNERHKTIRELMTPAAFARLINKARGGRHAA